MYIGDEPSEDASLELLLDAMELSGYWRLKYFFEEVQRTIVKRRLLTPLTLESSKFSLFILFSDAKAWTTILLALFYGDL
jgi:hypothetical protein